MAIDYVALKSELTNNPNSLTDGQNTLTQLYTAGRDNEAAALLNAAAAAQKFYRNNISPAELLACIDRTEFATIAAADVTLMGWWLTQAGTLDANNAVLRGFFSAAFSGKTTTLGRLTALIALRNGSRAEALFGIGTVITGDDIAKARAS